MTEIPSALTATPNPGGRGPRRARHNIPGRRAGIIPPARPGEVVFKLFPTNETLRVWGRRYGFDVKDHGPVPKAVREHFDTWNAWSVRIVSGLIPGAKHVSQYYKVMQGSYERRLTVDPDMVRRELGPELFALLKQVET